MRMAAAGTLSCPYQHFSGRKDGSESFLALWHWVSATQRHVNWWSPQKLFPMLAKSEWRVEISTMLSPSAAMVLSYQPDTALLLTKEAKRQRTVFTQGQ